MSRLRISRYAVLTILLTTSATALSPALIFPRQNTCGAAEGLDRCATAGLPANFCCPSGSECISLAGNTTVLCCPVDKDCSQIQPIICDITKQDPVKNPGSTVKTNALTVPLPKCGAGCCPHGFSCNSSNLCVKNANQDQKPVAPQQSGSSSQVPSTPAPTATPTPRPSTTTALNESPTINPLPASSEDSQPNQFPAPAVLVGFFPGLLLGIFLTIGFIAAFGSYRRRKAASRNPQKRTSGSSFGNISEPQLQSDIRSDFLRKGTVTPSREPTLHRVKSLFRRSYGPNAGIGELADYQHRTSGGNGVGGGWGAGGGMTPIPLNIQQYAKNPSGKNIRPVTPPLQREPSLKYENIDIFTDGDTASALRNNFGNRGNGGLAPPPRIGSHELGEVGNRITTFSDMMERSGLAGLQKGQPFVYKGNSPGYTPPR